jgi:glycosyltransferase involved in cell wall biosynthesis
MNIWIATIYEPLPFGDPKTRPQRCGMLAKALLDRGHKVELWTSAFDHVSHKHYHKDSTLENVGDRMSIQFIKGCGYSNDLSPKRLLHNRQTGKEFSRLAISREKLPDIIIAPVPILELAQSAVDYANERKIPIIVDVRDLWPDVYLTLLPKFLHSIGKIFFYSEYERAKFIFANATGITAVSKAYLKKGLSYACRVPQDEDNFFPLGSVDAATSDYSQQNKNSIFQCYGMNEGQFIVTFVGTFSKFLDIKNILDAARYLTDLKDIHIIIIGTGKHFKEFNEMADRLPNVTMTGWLNAQAIRTILHYTDVGLAAYAKDALMSLPNKPFEYMAAGLPLLSSLPGELEELIRMNHIGRGYIAGDPLSLSNEIRWFYAHPEETKKMGERSIDLFSKKFRNDILYKEFSEHLERIVNCHDRK